MQYQSQICEIIWWAHMLIVKAESTRWTKCKWYRQCCLTISVTTIFNTVHCLQFSPICTKFWNLICLNHEIFLLKTVVNDQNKSGWKGTLSYWIYPCCHVHSHFCVQCRSLVEQHWMGNFWHCMLEFVSQNTQWWLCMS
jgi:hypothetical protein